MKFFLDANMPYSSKEVFKKFGKVQNAKDINLQGALDDEIFDFVIKNKAILVTKDLEFGNPYIYNLKQYAGLIIIRVPFYFKSEQLNKILNNFLSSTEIKDLEKSITIVEPGKIRIRKIKE